MKAHFGAAVLLAMTLIASSPARAQNDTAIGALRTNFSVLGFERPLRTEDSCRARPDQRTCLLGNGAIVWIDDQASERRALAYVLTAHHVLRALCRAASQSAAISAFGGPTPMIAVPVQITPASCQNLRASDDPDIAIVQIDISQLRYPPAEEGAPLAPPARPIGVVPIGPSLRDGEMYRAFGFDRDRRAIDYAPKAAEHLDDGDPWEFYMRVPSNPGLSGSPVMIERGGVLAIVGVIARDPPMERCQFSADSGAVSDLQTFRCEMRQGKVNWLLSIGVELQRSRSALASLPIERMEVADGRRRIDDIRRYYDYITRQSLNEEATLVSLRSAFGDAPPSLATGLVNWGAYFRSLTPLQVTRLLVYWEEKFPNCLVPESVAYQFSQIASRIYDDAQIERLIQDTNQRCPQARFRALQNQARLLEGMSSLDRLDPSVAAFADNLGERYNLSREQVFSAAGNRNLSAVLSERSQVYQAVQ